MIALLVWVCLASAPTDCHVEVIARDFVVDDQCKAHAGLMFLGWMSLRQGLVLRDGTEPFCVQNPDWYMSRFGAGI